MKILHITPEYPPAAGYGIARYVSEVSRGLTALDHEVHVLVTDPAEADVTADGKDFVHRMTSPYPFFGYSACLDAVMHGVPSLERTHDLWAKVGPFDLVVGHGWASSLPATMAQRVFGCPLVATLHDVRASFPGVKPDSEDAYIAEMERWFADRANKVVVLSEALRNDVERHYSVSRDKIEVIPGGAAAETFSSDVDREDFRSMFAEPEERIILFAGRLVPEKGPDVLLGAARVLLSRGERVRLVLAGDGPLRDRLAGEAERLGISDSVRFAGYLGPSVLGGLYQVSDVLAVPSRYEPFGWAAVEAALHSLPVVASSCGGLLELARILPAGVMHPVAPGDEGGLAAMISLVLKSSKLKRRDPRPSQVRLPASLAWQKLSRKTADLYESVVPVPKG